MNSILWADSSLQQLSVDYDTVSISVKESTGLERRISCVGHIAVELCGFWDEMIIENATLDDTHPAIERCWNHIKARLGDAPPETGSSKRNAQEWHALAVRFIDGCELVVVAAEFKVEP